MGEMNTPRTDAKICGMGHSMKRKEDPRFIRGQGRYIDDFKLPGMLYMDIVRSPHAHAKIKKIDTSKALSTTCTGCRPSRRTPRWCCRSTRSCTRRRKCAR
jgi:xanthine dehydrogenase molybdopterin-binding subunit B